MRGVYAGFAFHQKGFTLLEVMVALGILAVVAVTAMQAASSYTQTVSNMQARTLAHFVAENTLNDLRINQQWLTAPQTQQVTAQGQSWQVTLTPSDTPIDTVQQIRVAVAPIDSNGNAMHNITDLDGVLIKPVGRAP